MTAEAENRDVKCTCCEEASEEELLARLDDVIAGTRKSQEL